MQTCQVFAQTVTNNLQVDDSTGYGSKSEWSVDLQQHKPQVGHYWKSVVFCWAVNNYINKWINNRLYVISCIAHAIIKCLLLKLLRINGVGIGHWREAQPSRTIVDNQGSYIITCTRITYYTRWQKWKLKVLLNSLLKYSTEYAILVPSLLFNVCALDVTTKLTVVRVVKKV